MVSRCGVALSAVKNFARAFMRAFGSCSGSALTRSTSSGVP